MAVNLEQKWAYDEPGPDGNVHVVKTEKEILDTFFEFWSNELIKQKKFHLITDENCIDDWVAVNWAYKV